MAAQTFRGVWSIVALHAPDVPISLIQAWTQDAYDELIGRRHWGWTRRQHVLTTLAQRSVTPTYVQGSTAITSAAEFLATDAGRQIRVANQFIYTIDAVADPSNATLLEAYGESSGAESAAIADHYLARPEDFRSFNTVDDMSNQRPIVWWISKERLDLFDPGRISADSRFRVLAAHQISQATPTFGRVLYEAWPTPTAAGSYVMSYYIRTDTLANDATFQGVLATYTHALVDGALAQAAKWPGTAERRNPYFNLALANKLQSDFESSCKSLDLMDDDQYLQDLLQIDLARFGLASISASTNLLRASDASVGDYYQGYI